MVPPQPLVPDPETRDTLVEILIDLVGALTPFSRGRIPPTEGVALDTHLPAAGGLGPARLVLRPHCGCARPDCVACLVHLPERNAACLADEGFVETLGLPNFRLLCEGADIRIWWHRHIGRGLRLGTTGDVDPDGLRDRIEALFAMHRAALIAPDVARALVAVPLLDEATRDLLGELFRARLDAVCMPGRATHDTLTGLETIARALERLYAIGRQAAEAGEMVEILDRCGAPQLDDPVDPPEFQIVLRPARRLCRLLGLPHSEDHSGF